MNARILKVNKILHGRQKKTEIGYAVFPYCESTITEKRIQVEIEIGDRCVSVPVQYLVCMSPIL